MKLWHVLVIIAFVWISSALFAVVYGEDYKYKMTKNEKDDFFVSQMCIAGVEVNVTNISECKFLYGGINTNYGEAIK
jgi:hypothetical protein